MVFICLSPSPGRVRDKNLRTADLQQAALCDTDLHTETLGQLSDVDYYRRLAWAQQKHQQTTGCNSGQLHEQDGRGNVGDGGKYARRQGQSDLLLRGRDILLGNSIEDAHGTQSDDTHRRKVVEALLKLEDHEKVGGRR